jgi:uncharacterized protein with HEPN domain
VLSHIIECIAKISAYTENMDIHAFLSNPLVQDGVIRNLEIIGEASKNLDNSFRSRHPDIEWKKMAGMRDKLIHDYLGVDLWAVWGVVEKILPVLKDQIEAIIKSKDT